MPRHIFVTQQPETRDFISPVFGGESRLKLPQRDRLSHAQWLRQQFDQVWADWDRRREERHANSLPARTGCYLEVRGQAGYNLVIQSLEDLVQDIRLLHAHPNDNPPRACIFVPHDKRHVILKKMEDYESKSTLSGEPKNKKLIDGIEHIRLAILESFWNDKQNLIPGALPVWVEVWLNVSIEPATRDQQLDSFRFLLRQLGIQFRNDEALHFPERSILLVLADAARLISLIEASDHIAELRLAKETARFWLELNNVDQANWVQDLRGRLQVQDDARIAVCILDGGVNNGHLLIAPVLTDDDCHTWHPDWGKSDDAGHGTLMAGLIAYGDLQAALDDRRPIIIKHKLESVKIIPPDRLGDNPKHLWGDITQQAIARAIIQAPDRVRIVCMAVTTNDYDDAGRPSSWSGAVDQLTSDQEQRQLLIVSAGNLDNSQEWAIYPNANLTKSIQDPAQAWNALTVGAYTRLANITDPTMPDYRPIAQPDALSPFSTTSYTWDRKKWPIKPEVVFEGGNAARDSGGFCSSCDDLSLLSTCHKPTQRQFEFINATSAAAAQAAWFAAQVQQIYPTAWPETVRALIVHSAGWTGKMLEEYAPNQTKTEFQNLLRVCGYGVPNLRAAIECGSNSLVLVAEREIQPFAKERNSKGKWVYKTKEMHLFEMPWPAQALLGLPSEMDVTMRVTLSYFIEPSPDEIGWKDRYRYQSHALRFDVKTATESKEKFLARINKAAKAEVENQEFDAGSGRWTLGKNARDVGSIHSDYWHGSGADIAACNIIAVYPVIGWWRERHHLERYNQRTRYSLVVSIQTPDQTVDLYTPVVVQLGVPIMT